MAWSYELHGSESIGGNAPRVRNQEVKPRLPRGVHKRMMQAFDFPSDKKEDLTIVTKDEAAE